MEGKNKMVYCVFIFCRSVCKGRMRWFILCFFLQECVEGKNKMVYFVFIFCRSAWNGKMRWFILCLFSAGVRGMEE